MLPRHRRNDSCRAALVWLVSMTDDLGNRVTLETIGYSLPMQAIYDGITF